MKLFKPLYEKALRWASHKFAERYLGVLSFFEAIIFPIMPEVMLAPMVLARPQRWLRYATISLVCSLLGALVGYELGNHAFHYLRPLFDDLGWIGHIDSEVARLSELVKENPWTAFWTLVIAGFMPIPLKIFTWASGIVLVPLPAFIAAMVIGRGKRVYLLAALIRLGGARAEATLHRWIEWIGWFTVAAIVALGVYFKFMH